MREKTHELARDEETGAVVKVPVSQPETSTPARVWFPDETGYRGKPLEYEGQKFYVVSAKKSALRQFVRIAQKELPTAQKRLSASQQGELKALQDKAREEAKTQGLSEEEQASAANSVELSDERAEYYESEGEKLSEKLEAAYDELLSHTVIGWNLPREFSIELLKSFDIADKAELCRLIGARSMTGVGNTKN